MQNLMKILVCLITIISIIIGIIPAVYAEHYITDFELGDINEDGVISVTDVVLLRTAIMGDIGGISDEDFIKFDINSDSAITVSDIVTLRTKIMSSVDKPKLSLSPSECALEVGESILLSLGISAGTIDTTSVYSSSNPDIVYVDDAGNVTAIASGNATITAAYKALNAKSIITVTEKSEPPVSFENGTYSFQSAAYELVITVETDSLLLGEYAGNDNQHFLLENSENNTITIKTESGKSLYIKETESEQKEICIGSNTSSAFIPIKSSDNTYLLKSYDYPELFVAINDGNTGIIICEYGEANPAQKWNIIKVETKPEEPTEPTDPPDPVVRYAYVYNTNIGLNIRNGPGAAFERIGGFTENTIVTIHGGIIDGWYHVTGVDVNGQNVDGYCSAEYLYIIDEKPEEKTLKAPIRRNGTSTVTQEYKQGGVHNGIDIGSYSGVLVDILAAEVGTVINASGSCLHNDKKNISNYNPFGECCNGTMGNYIRIDHGNGIVATYMHLTSVSVKVGDTVKAGDIIGIMGTTGRSSGVHLHLEVKLNGVRKNPRDFISLAKSWDPIY